MTDLFAPVRPIIPPRPPRPGSSRTFLLRQVQDGAIVFRHDAGPYGRFYWATGKPVEHADELVTLYRAKQVRELEVRPDGEVRLTAAGEQVVNQ